MKKATESSLNKITPSLSAHIQQVITTNIRSCPSCGRETLAGMPGGRDATCKNCGYKDPCCYD